MTNIKILLEPFNLTVGKKQDFLTLLVHIKSNNVSMDELIDYLENLKKKQLEVIKKQNNETKQTQKHWNNMTQKCQQCNTMMQLYPVNTQPGNQTEDASRSVWICLNRNCMETIYNKQSVQEIIKEGR